MPPAEASAQLSPGEVVKRLEVLERERKEPFNTGLRPPLPKAQVQRAKRRREALRLLRIKKAVEAQDQRDKQHEQRVAPLVEKLEARIADIESTQRAEQERHAAAMGQLGAEHAELTGKVAALHTALNEGESSHDREKAVMGV